ncbi:hypothetical protein HN499_05945 [archaeon]|nr:hypothetical protein [archaeon]
MKKVLSLLTLDKEGFPQEALAWEDTPANFKKAELLFKSGCICLGVIPENTKNYSVVTPFGSIHFFGAEIKKDQ